jgi:hypothetical protein
MQASVWNSRRLALCLPAAPILCRGSHLIYESCCRDWVPFWRGQLGAMISAFKKFQLGTFVEGNKTVEYVPNLSDSWEGGIFLLRTCVCVYFYRTMQNGWVRVEGEAAAVPLRHVAPVLRARAPASLPRNQWTVRVTPSRLGSPTALQPSLLSSRFFCLGGRQKERRGIRGITWKLVIIDRLANIRKGGSLQMRYHQP